MSNYIIMVALIYAAPQLVHHGELEYLVSDYLSEITMSLLAAVKAKRSVCQSATVQHPLALTQLVIIIVLHTVLPLSTLSLLRICPFTSLLPLLPHPPLILPSLTCATTHACFLLSHLPPPTPLPPLSSIPP